MVRLLRHECGLVDPTDERHGFTDQSGLAGFSSSFLPRQVTFLKAKVACQNERHEVAIDHESRIFAHVTDEHIRRDPSQRPPLTVGDHDGAIRRQLDVERATFGAMDSVGDRSGDRLGLTDRLAKSCDGDRGDYA